MSDPEYDLARPGPTEVGISMIAASDLTEVAPGIFYTDRPVVAVDQGIIAFLKEAAARSPSKRARLCAHPSPDAIQQDMLIVSHRDTYVAPHRHLTKTETMLIIEGEAEAVIFGEAGAISDVLPMGPAGSGRLFFYRMPERTHHGLLINSEMLVFTESTRGPFRPEDSENAPWAPAPADSTSGQRFAAALRARCRDFRRPGA
jgi:cupin fold WbuC family metalloprotein